MYLHKTTGTASGKTAPELPAKKVPESKTLLSTPSTPAAKPSTAASPVPARSTSALIAAAGLPIDKLSASLVSFARFFSLPLKPELMAAMRRQALTPHAAVMTQAEAIKHAAPENAAEAGAIVKNREALSLAAAAAESKGIELTPEGLEEFAESIDPEWHKRHNADGHNQQRRKNKNRHEQEKENAPSKISSITAASLKEMALEPAEHAPLLAMLNRLPGKNGQRWIVLPFVFRDDNREFTVSLRILLEAGHQVSNRVRSMSLDITESGSTEKPEPDRRWLFVLEPVNGLRGKMPAHKLNVYIQPEIPPRAAAPFVRELSRFTEIPPERIVIKKRTESFPGESGCRNEQLRSINEAV